MADMNFRDDGYAIEENDDPRTCTGELVPDCKKELDVPFEEETDSPDEFIILEYVGEFSSLISACGMVSYFWNMKHFIAEKVKKAEDVAAAYKHDKEYYEEQYREWKAKAKRSFVILGVLAEKLKYKMPPERSFLNDLTLYSDRRDCYKYYLNSYLKKNITFSPDELEEKYKSRVKKRLKS